MQLPFLVWSCVLLTRRKKKAGDIYIFFIEDSNSDTQRGSDLLSNKRAFFSFPNTGLLKLELCCTTGDDLVPLQPLYRLDVVL